MKENLKKLLITIIVNVIHIALLLLCFIIVTKSHGENAFIFLISCISLIILVIYMNQIKNLFYNFINNIFK